MLSDPKVALVDPSPRTTSLATFAQVPSGPAYDGSAWLGRRRRLRLPEPGNWRGYGPHRLLERGRRLRRPQRDGAWLCQSLSSLLSHPQICSGSLPFLWFAHSATQFSRRPSRWIGSSPRIFAIQPTAKATSLRARPSRCATGRQHSLTAAVT